jgi:hypothetical protein
LGDFHGRGGVELEREGNVGRFAAALGVCRGGRWNSGVMDSCGDTLRSQESSTLTGVRRFSNPEEGRQIPLPRKRYHRRSATANENPPEARPLPGAAPTLRRNRLRNKLGARPRRALQRRRRAGSCVAATERAPGRPPRPAGRPPRAPAPGRLPFRHGGVRPRRARGREEDPGLLRGDVVGSASTRPARAPSPSTAQPAPRPGGKVAAQPGGAVLALEGPHGWREAARITEVAARMRPSTSRSAATLLLGVVLVEDLALPERRARTSSRAAHSWVELADWIPSVLAGVDDPAKVVRGICAAGHKALYSDEWGGLPDKEFLAALDPRLAALRDRLYERAHDATTPAGALCAAGPRARPSRRHPDRDRGIRRPLRGDRLRRPGGHARQGDRHLDLRLRGRVVRKKVPDIPGICGIVPGAILPGILRDRGGAVGGRRHLQLVGRDRLRRRPALHARLTAEAARQEPGESGLLALDWHNGNRTDPRRPEALRAPRRLHAAHDARRDLPRAHRGDGLRRADDHRAHPRIRRADPQDRLRRAASRRRTRSSCRSTPT